ncbi:MAG TPA: DUF2905 domain-containing protein [Candidatus Kryptobacter bacterium]|nr:DUF2905 domain-containing protein [Candidatus Kryptobacter bacterium]
MESLQGFGKTLIVVGAVIIVAGILFMLSEKMNFPFFGKLPGDIHIKGKNFQLYFPIVTSIVLSVLLSLVLYAISYFSKR